MCAPSSIGGGSSFTTSGPHDVLNISSAAGIEHEMARRRLASITVDFKRHQNRMIEPSCLFDRPQMILLNVLPGGRAVE